MENEIVMPRLGVNDDYVVLVQWQVNDGAWVKKGESIAIIETSKETSEIIAESDGVINLCVKEGVEVEVGNIIAVIGEKQKSEENLEEKFESEQYKITEKAKELIKKYKIDISLLPKNKLIKEKDVLTLIKKPYQITESKHNSLLIYGGGGFGRISIDILRLNPVYKIHGIIDSNYPDVNEVMGIPVLGNDETLKMLYNEGYHLIFNAVGFKNKSHWRRPIYEMLKDIGFSFSNVIHKSAIIEQSVSIGDGNLVCAGAIIGTQAYIGSNCIINAGSVISHDCIISDHCHIASGAVLAGNVVIGENTLIGQNCTIYSDVKIGKNVVIQNGCNVFKDVADGEVVLLQ